MPNTTAVAVTFTLDSTDLANTPPYNVASCSGQISYEGGGGSNFTGWNAETIGTPQPSGAAFSLGLTDSGYSAGNQTSIGNWALTFIPRGSTTQASPFGNNVNTITGSGASGSNGVFSLNVGNVKIKNAGNWDWSLMAQVNIPGGAIHCYASDPEMDVNS